jgi:aspartyl aminopeptidase
MAVYDHEEIGSTSYIGAKSNFLPRVLKFLCDSNELEYGSFKAKSLFVSADMGHYSHPNFGWHQDRKNILCIGSGVWVKHCVLSNYSIDDIGENLIELMGRKAEIKVGYFIKKNGPGGGGTIGPKVEAKVGIPSIDIGCGQWAMHSAREAGYLKDYFSLQKLLIELFSNYQSMMNDYELNS